MKQSGGRSKHFFVPPGPTFVGLDTGPWPRWRLNSCSTSLVPSCPRRPAAHSRMRLLGGLGWVAVMREISTGGAVRSHKRAEKQCPHAHVDDYGRNMHRTCEFILE